MSLAVIDDYFSFMSDKSGEKAVPGDLHVVVQRLKAFVPPDVTDRARQSQMEVTESPLSDTAINRIFSPPDA